MKFSNSIIIAFIGVVAYLLVLAVWLGKGERSSSGEGQRSASESTSHSRNLPGSDNPVDQIAESPGMSAELESTILAARNLLLQETNPNTRHEILAALITERRRGSGRKATVSAIIRFLDSSLDAPSGLMFTVGTNGHLKTAPSLRTALLDELGRLDREEAARYAEKIYQLSDIPDEWALAMRDQARVLGQPAVRESALPGRVRQLLSRSDWNEKPTAGFLHAFDVAVFVGGEDMAASLKGVWEKGTGTPTEFAARLALDRIAQSDFAAVAKTLVSSESTHPVDRADILARADVRDPEQFVVIESYISSPSVGLEEKMRFIESLPNGNLQLSSNLVTQDLTPSMESLYQRDQATLDILKEWSARSDFSALHSAIEPRIAWLEKLLASRNP